MLKYPPLDDHLTNEWQNYNPVDEAKMIRKIFRECFV
jgi:hypothetical protein